jgi:hypothetical protein
MDKFFADSDIDLEKMKNNNQACPSWVSCVHFFSIAQYYEAEQGKSKEKKVEVLHL